VLTWLRGLRVSRWLGRVHIGRWNVFISLPIGVFFFFDRLFVDDRTLYRSFMEGAIAAFVAMQLFGTAVRFLNRGEVEEVGGPGGWTMRFAQATTRPLRILVDGLISQMDAVNARLLSLEEDVARLKGTPPETDPQE
jgi:hypothetical protein